MNPYDVLNVRDNASDMDIKKAYLTYKRRFDLENYSGDHEYAIRRMTEIEKAFKILSDPQLRNAFDNRYNSHVKSHVVKKDVYKEYYQNDPIGTHYHRDYDLAMKKYNANKPLFDFTKSAIKTYDDNLFEDENIKDYSEFNNKKITNSMTKLIIFIAIGTFLLSILSPLFAMFQGFSEIFENAFYEPEDSSSYYEYNDSYNDYDTYNSYNNNDYDYTSSSSSTSTTTEDENKIDVNDYYTDQELYEMYNTTYKGIFDSFYEFKNYLNDSINENN